jgi:hypothetical protein
MDSQTIQEIKNIINRMEDEDIYNILDGAIFFSGKFEILFYAKKERTVSGYLMMRNRTFYFEIRLYKFSEDKEFTIGITVGKMNTVKKVEGVI